MGDTYSLAGTMGMAPVSFAPVPSRQRWPGVLVVALLVLLVLQGWAPQVLDRPSATTTGATDARAAATDAGIDVDGVVEGVRHQVRPGPGGSLAVEGDGYDARFDAAGLTYVPEGSGAGLGIALTGIERGGGALPLSAGAWAGRANVAERAVSRP